jgi:2-dehydro-3-deoxyglucarate aldolase
MGLTAQFDHPDVLSAMAKILKLTLASKVSCGIHVVAPSVEQLNQRVSQGYRFVAYSIDAVMLTQAITRPQVAG